MRVGLDYDWLMELIIRAVTQNGWYKYTVGILILFVFYLLICFFLCICSILFICLQTSSTTSVLMYLLYYFKICYIIFVTQTLFPTTCPSHGTVLLSV